MKVGTHWPIAQVANLLYPLCDCLADAHSISSDRNTCMWLSDVVEAHSAECTGKNTCDYARGFKLSAGLKCNGE